MTRHYYHESAEALRQAVAAIPDFGEPAGAGEASAGMGEVSARGAPETGGEPVRAGEVSARGAPETGGEPARAGEVSARGAPETGGGPVMTQGQLGELAKIYSRLKRIFEPG